MPRALFVALSATILLTACDTPPVMPKDWEMRQVFRETRAPRVPAPPPNPLGLPEALLTQRIALVAGREVTDADLSAIADYGDGYAAWIYAERLSARDDRALVMEMMTYYAIAADAGRAGGIPRLVQLMNYPEFQEAATDEDLARLETLLRRYAIEEKDTQAALFLVQRYNLGTPFGPRSGEEVVDLLRTLADGGDTRIALNLAKQILQSPDLAEDPAQRDEARRYLEIAMTSENISIQVTAQNLRTLMDRRDGLAPIETAAEIPPTLEETAL